MIRTLLPMFICGSMLAAANGCKTDVGPKRKVVSDKITARKGVWWKQAHVLAIRRVEKGTYSGRGSLPGINKWQRGYMRYHLVLTGSRPQRRLFLYEAQYRSEKGKGKGADKLLLKGSADDRCVAYSNDGGRKWRFVRLLGSGVPINFPLPLIEAKASAPCATAPPLRAHFLTQLKSTEHGLDRAELKNILTFLGLFPKDSAYHTTFARFLVTEGRRQYFEASLKAQWQPVIQTACSQQTVRDIYLKRVGTPRLLGRHPHTNALLVLETCNRADVQDSLAALLNKKPTGVETHEHWRTIARVFARITDHRKAASPSAKAAVIGALPTAVPRVQAYLARALGTLGGTDAHAALRLLTAKAGSTTPPTKPAPKPDWPTFDELVKRVDTTPRAQRKDLVLQIARAGLKR